MLGEQVEIPLIIGGKEVRTGKTRPVVCPHEHGHVLGDLPTWPRAEDVGAGGRRSLGCGSWHEWSEMPWEASRRDLPQGRRHARRLLAQRRSTRRRCSANQSKTAFQAEIDAACELIDFLRFNAHYMQQIYRGAAAQLARRAGTGVEQRALEGFVFAVTPFNFTSIAGNLPTVAGADGQHRALEAGFERAALGLLRHEAAAEGRSAATASSTSSRAPVAQVGDPASRSPQLAGVHFTGSTAGLPAACGARSARTSPSTRATRASSARPAARTSCSPTRRPTSTQLCVGARPRRFRVPGPEVLGRELAPTSRSRSGRPCATPSSITSAGSRWARPRTSATSWAR